MENLENQRSNGSQTPPAISQDVNRVDVNINEDHGVYCRKIKNKLGEVTHEKYEPRLKRGKLKQSLSLGQYDTPAEAKIVLEIAIFFYDNNQFGRLDFEDSRYSGVELGPSDDGSRYFVIPPLTEKKEGKEKATFVSRKAKEVYKQFKEQAEYQNLHCWMKSLLRGGVEKEEPGRDDVVNAEEHLNVHLEDRPLDLPSTQASHNDQVGDSAVGTINCNVTSNSSSRLNGCFGTMNSASHATGTSQPTAFVATNSCFPCLEGFQDAVLKRHGVVNGEGHANGHWDVRHLDLRNIHLQQPPLNARIGNSAVDGTMLDNHVMTSNISSGLGDTSGPTPLTATNRLHFSDPHGPLDSSMEDVPALPREDPLGMELPESRIVNYEAGQTVALQQLVNALQQTISCYQQVNTLLQQENQELKRKFSDHLLSCPGVNRPSKR